MIYELYKSIRLIKNHFYFFGHIETENGHIETEKSTIEKVAAILKRKMAILKRNLANVM